MNVLLNREAFETAEGGWFHLAPLGEFPHTTAGVVQVVDAEACTMMAARFGVEAAEANFAGLLVDFDHFSLSGEMRSEAAGWITGLEYRAPGQLETGSSGENAISRGSAEGAENRESSKATTKHAKDAKTGAEDGSGSGRSGPAGLWAKIRWSDVGEAAVKGGRYRFLSPVWARANCEELSPSTSSGQAGSGQAMQRVRPVRLFGAALTNDPNLKGLAPLSNRSQEPETRIQNADAGKKEEIHHEGREGTRRGMRTARPEAVALPENADAGRKETRVMNRVIEKLLNHLGLAADTAEDLVLEKMQGLAGPTAVADLQNSLTQAQTALTQAREELVNRDLAEFEGLMSPETKGFWSAQLLQNRDGALAALKDLGKAKTENSRGGAEHAEGNQRKPLHNRATARPVIPGVGAGPSTGSGQAESAAMRIRNRAHEIVKDERVAFSTAFRRAEAEVCGE